METDAARAGKDQGRAEAVRNTAQPEIKPPPKAKKDRG
jgi:hypothetical protein